ncbi:MAG: hypothetical protein AAGB35_09085, partial [Pseudomonadota bacterium]
MKKVLIVLIILIAIVAAGVYYVLGNLDSIVKSAIEKNGSEVTGTSVDVGSVSIKLTEGSATIDNFKVGNPKGFDSDYLFSMNKTRVQIDTSRLSTDLIVIKEVLLDGPSINYELSANGSNVDAIKKNVESSSSGSSSSESSSGSSGPKIIIQNLVIQNGEVMASSSMVKGQTLKTKLPRVQMTNLGGSSGGTSEEISKQIIDELLQQIGAAAKNLDLSKLMNTEMLEKMGKD